MLCAFKMLQEKDPPRGTVVLRNMRLYIRPWFFRTLGKGFSFPSEGISQPDGSFVMLASGHGWIIFRL